MRSKQPWEGWGNAEPRIEPPTDENVPNRQNLHHHEKESKTDGGSKWHKQCLSVLDRELTAQAQTKESDLAQRKEFEDKLLHLQAASKEARAWKDMTAEVVSDLRAEVKLLRKEVHDLRSDREQASNSRGGSSGGGGSSITDADVARIFHSFDAHVYLKAVVKDQLEKHFHDVLHSHSLPAAEERLRREINSRFEAQDIRLRSHDSLSDSISARMQSVEQQTSHLSQSLHHLQIKTSAPSLVTEGMVGTRAPAGTSDDTRENLVQLSTSVDAIARDVARLEKAGEEHPALVVVQQHVQRLQEQVQELRHHQVVVLKSHTTTATTLPSDHIASTAAALLREEFTRMLDFKLKSVVEQTMRYAGGSRSLECKVDQMVRDILDIRQQHRSTFATVQGRFASLDIQLRKSSGIVVSERGTHLEADCRVASPASLEVQSKSTTTSSPTGRLHLRSPTASASSPKASSAVADGLSRASTEELELRVQAQEQRLEDVRRSCETKVEDVSQQVCQRGALLSRSLSVLFFQILFFFFSFFFFFFSFSSFFFFLPFLCLFFVPFFLHSVIVPIVKTGEIAIG